MKKRDYFSKHVKEIQSLAMQTDVYSLHDLNELLKTAKEKSFVSQSMTSNEFYGRLIDIGLHTYSIFMDGNYLSRYSFHADLSDEKLVTSFRKRAFLSMSSALNYLGLSGYRNDFIFVSQEQSDKSSYTRNNLTQDAIDNAFSKNYRRTHKIGKYKERHIVFLQPKHTGDYGVVEVDDVRVSSVNRALVEMIVNVQYFRNSRELIEVFKKIKNQINVAEVYEVVKRFDFIYPYFQSIGYILEEIGFSKKELIAFKEKISVFDFYTDKAINSYDYVEYWKMNVYPK